MPPVLANIIQQKELFFNASLFSAGEVFTFSTKFIEHHLQNIRTTLEHRKHPKPST